MIASPENLAGDKQLPQLAQRETVLRRQSADAQLNCEMFNRHGQNYCWVTPCLAWVLETLKRF
jgi:hypothetical protein